MKYSAGLDLAQSSDFTALEICRRSRGLLRALKYEVVFARRWRGTAYPVLVEEISSILNRQPFVDDVRLNLDATGVGAPVLDLFERAKSEGLLGCEINAIIFTAANEPNPTKNTVPKKDLITRLEVLLAEKRLDFARDLGLGPMIKEELKNFGYKLSAAGKATFNAAGSGHDDLVSALALAVYEAPSVMAFTLSSSVAEDDESPGWAKLTTEIARQLPDTAKGAVRCPECRLVVALSPDVLGALRTGLFGHFDPFCFGSFEYQQENPS
jgi:terminase large subunit-like protein